MSIQVDLHKLKLSLVLTGFISLFGFEAVALEIYKWMPEANGPTMVIAVRDGESPSSAAKRYLESVVSETELAELLHRDPLPKFSLKNFAPLTDSDFEARVLLIANRPSDMRAGDWRVPTFSKSFSRAGLYSYLVPIAYDSGLAPDERAEFISKLDAKFSHFVAMGGADTDPEIFGEKNSHSHHVNARRDRAEIALLTEKIESILRNPNGKDRLTGVCRGAQLVSRILGYSLVQDIPTEVGTRIDHNISKSRDYGAGERTHVARVLDTTSNFLKNLVGGATQILVNSYHHQQIIWKAGGQLELAAIAEDGVPEALESRDGRIRLFQFHPELMAERAFGAARRFGASIMREIAGPARGTRLAPRCSAMFSRSLPNQASP